MNWSELSLFTENLGKCIQSGIKIDRALELAGEIMASGKNRKFVQQFTEAVLNGDDLTKKLRGFDIPGVYAAVMQCGHLTGRLPEACISIGSLLKIITPMKVKLQRCMKASVISFFISLTLSIYVGHWASVKCLFIFLIVFLLFKYVRLIREFCDMVLAKIPVSKQWCRQFSQMEFFLCLSVCYDSGLNVADMYNYSINAISNSYLKKKMVPAKKTVIEGGSFTDSFVKTGMITAGIVRELNIGEISGTLDKSLDYIIGKLTLLVDAMIEPVKAVTVFFVLSFAVSSLLLAILPFYISDPWVISAIIGQVTGSAAYGCLRYGLQGYFEASAGAGIWWRQMHTGAKTHFKA